jgi:hypothetical protein
MRPSSRLRLRLRGREVRGKRLGLRSRLEDGGYRQEAKAKIKARG